MLRFRPCCLSYNLKICNSAPEIYCVSLMYGETPQTSGFIIKEASSTHVIGTLGLMVPHLVVKKNPCSDMKAKEQNVTRLPIPGSLLDLKKSISITILLLHIDIHIHYDSNLLHKKLEEYYVGCTTDQHDEYYECDG